jgi:hypothetical protein
VVKNYNVEQTLMGGSGTVDILIADDLTERATSTLVIQVPFNSVFTRESVVATLNLLHSTHGDLLHPSKRHENTLSNEWKLMTVRLLGESPSGDIIDHSKGYLSDCADLPWSYSNTVDTESIPQRLPGFWDYDGHCFYLKQRPQVE